jgi:hypothetical protein
VSKKVVALSSFYTVINGQASRPMNACCVDDKSGASCLVGPQVVARLQRNEIIWRSRTSNRNKTGRSMTFHTEKNSPTSRCACVSYRDTCILSQLDPRLVCHRTFASVQRSKQQQHQREKAPPPVRQYEPGRFSSSRFSVTSLHRRVPRSQPLNHPDHQRVDLLLHGRVRQSRP